MGTHVSTVKESGFKKSILLLEKYVNLASRLFYWIAGIGLIAMLVLVVGDIIGIKVFSKPIPGGIEVAALLGVVVNGFAIAFVQVLHGHIQVDFILMKFPPRAKAIVDMVMTLLGIAFFAILAWRSWDYARVMQLSGEVTMTQEIPFYPFIYGLAVSYFVTFLVLVVEFLKLILKAGTRWTQSISAL
jgi:TRAP-type C4-dicarboxylate transport system permease small subunit